MTTRLDISIGPVQGFVAQSRRTRDLWGSSYLLAFLSAHAMHGAETAGGAIVQPVVSGDPLYQWVAGNRNGDAPRIGSVPNHFVVKLDGDARAVAYAAIKSLNVAWERVCHAVWEKYVEGAVSAGDGTAGIWERQVSTFWEVTWTAGVWSEDAGGEEGGGLLHRRKHWRSHHPPDEPGDKCTVMHDLQEISGIVRARESKRQDAFWKLVQSRAGSLDFRDNERLCAVALVKRLFPTVAPAALGWELDVARWISTVDVGAAPWRRRVASAVPQQAAEYAKAVRGAARDSVLTVRPGGFAPPEAGDFPKLDGNYLHRGFVTNEGVCSLAEDARPGAREELAAMLKGIYDAADAKGSFGPPPSFYALLLADGDRLGKLVSGIGGEQASEALKEFTNKVPQALREHGPDGVTVYAGGDDVLAMLPLPRALVCARALSDAYRAAFAKTDARDQATLSAAVVIAQVRLPLSQVLGEARRLLDEVAKDENGRDSLAVAVLKPAGLHCQWVTTWARRSGGGDADAVALVHDLAQQIGENAAEPGLSSALVYRMRDILTQLCGWDSWQPGHWGAVPEDIDIGAFLRAEIHHSLDVRTSDGAADARAAALAEGVLNLLGRSRNPRRGVAGVKGAHNDNGALAQAGVDALLLARFLANPDQGESD